MNAKEHCVHCERRIQWNSTHGKWLHRDVGDFGHDPIPKGYGLSPEFKRALSALKGWEQWWNDHGFEWYVDGEIFDSKTRRNRGFRKDEKPPVTKASSPLYGITSDLILESTSSEKTGDGE